MKIQRENREEKRKKWREVNERTEDSGLEQREVWFVADDDNK